MEGNVELVYEKMKGLANAGAPFGMTELLHIEVVNSVLSDNEDVTVEEIEKALDELVGKGLIYKGTREHWAMTAVITYYHILWSKVEDEGHIY